MLRGAELNAAFREDGHDPVIAFITQPEAARLAEAGDGSAAVITTETPRNELGLNWLLIGHSTTETAAALTPHHNFSNAHPAAPMLFGLTVVIDVGEPRGIHH